MKNKELILILEELKQQVEECRDRDSSPYIDGLLRRTDFIINSLSVNNGVLDGVSKPVCDFEKGTSCNERSIKMRTGTCRNCGGDAYGY